MRRDSREQMILNILNTYGSEVCFQFQLMMDDSSAVSKSRIGLHHDDKLLGEE